jgi:hypothetical protein
VDSVPDRLSPYLDPQNDLQQEAAGLARLWPTDESLAAIDQWSLLAIAQGEAAAPPAQGGQGAFVLPERLALVWSAADPRQPQATTADTAAALAQSPGTWVMDTRLRGHVFSNADSAAATALVDYLLTGTPGSIDWQAGAAAADSGDDTGEP